MKIRWPAAAAAALLCAPAGEARAQIDYRNLDDDRPALVEDAYPIERYAFELLFPWSSSRERGAAATHGSVLELAYGFALGAHAGLKLPLASDAGGGNRRWGISGLRAFVLYNFNTEGPALPALSARVDGHFPVGSLGGDATRAEFKVIGTRTFGRARLHLNAAVGLGPDAAGPALEGAPRWWYGAALDRVFFRQSLLLVAEVYARRERRGDAVEVNASLGARWQWTPTLVLDAGVTRRLRATGPDYGVTAGVSHAFALAGLMP